MGYFSDLDIARQELESFEEVLTGEKDMENIVGKMFVYDWQYRKLGGFEAKLADVIQHADSGNQRSLLKAFPDKVKAIMDYQSKEGWWKKCVEDVENYRASFK